MAAVSRFKVLFLSALGTLKFLPRSDTLKRLCHCCEAGQDEAIFHRLIAFFGRVDDFARAHKYSSKLPAAAPTPTLFRSAAVAGQGYPIARHSNSKSRSI